MALGLMLLFLQRQPPPGVVEGEALFEGFEQELARAIEVTDSDGEGIRLAKEAGVWVIPAEANYSADPQGVRDILDFISEARSSRMVSSNPEKRSMFDLDEESGLGVRITGAEDAVLADFRIGKTGPDYMSTYVRPQDSDEIFLVDETLRRIFVRPSVRQWRDKAIFRFSGSDIIHLMLEREGEKVELEVDAGGNWTLTTPSSAPALRGEVETLRNALATLRCDDFAEVSNDGEAGLDQPYARIEFTLRGGATHALEVGRENDHSQRFVRRQGDETIFLVNNFRINSLLRSADELKAPPPEPEATGSEE